MGWRKGQRLDQVWLLGADEPADKFGDGMAVAKSKSTSGLLVEVRMLCSC